MSHLEPILEQVRRIPDLKQSLGVVFEDWAKRLDEAMADDGDPEEVKAVAEELRTQLDEVFAAVIAPKKPE